MSDTPGKGPGPWAQLVSYHRQHDDELRRVLRERVKDSSLREQADLFGISHVSLHRFLHGGGLKPETRARIERTLGRVPTVVIHIHDGKVTEVQSTNFDLRVVVLDGTQDPPLPPGLESVYRLDNQPDKE